MAEHKMLYCPACGTEDVKREFRAVTEKLLCKCGRCGYNWLQSPLYTLWDTVEEEESDE